MADADFEEFFGRSGILPPTSLDVIISPIAFSTAAATNVFGLNESGTITSTVLTQVLSIPNPGTIRYLACRTTVGGTRKIRITIDGNVVTDYDETVANGTTGLAIVGRANDEGGSAGVWMSLEKEIFNESLLVEIASDGVDPISLIYLTSNTG